MCGRLNFHSLDRKIKDVIHVIGRRGSCEAIWNGFARKEAIDWWIRESAAQFVTIENLTSFNEQGNNYPVNGILQAIGINRDVVDKTGKLVSERGDVKIVTRPASTQHERETHNRWPLVIQKYGGTEIIQYWDHPLDKK